MNRPPLRALLAAASLLLAAPRCTPEVEQADKTCESLSDCPLGQVCELTSRSCIPRPPDRLLGRFQCTVAEESPDRTSYPPDGTTEVTGQLSTRQLSLLDRSQCLLVNDDLKVRFFSVSTNNAYLYLEAVLRGARQSQSGAILALPQRSGTLGAGLTSGISGVDNVFSTLGATLDGRLQYIGSLAEGAVIEGYIDAALAPACDPGAQTPCPGSLSCVFLNDRTSLCLVPVADGVCNETQGRFCPGGEDCYVPPVLDDELNASSEGACRPLCAATSDCDDGLTCVRRGTSATGFCLQPVARGESCGDADSPCDAASVCTANSQGKFYCAGPACTTTAPTCPAGQQCLTNASGEDGVCDVPIPLFDRCNPPHKKYCANDATCILVDENDPDGRCTRYCTKDADCPAGHPCTVELTSGKKACEL